MIVYVGREFLNLEDGQKEIDAQEMVEILDHGHYLDMDPDVKEAVTDFVENRLLQSQKDIFQNASEFLSPTKMMKRWLRTIKFYDFSKEQRKIILLKPSELLVENAPNEWPVYKKICQAYSVDPNYSLIYKYILRL